MTDQLVCKYCNQLTPQPEEWFGPENKVEVQFCVLASIEFDSATLMPIGVHTKDVQHCWVKVATTRVRVRYEECPTDKFPSWLGTAKRLKA